MSTDIASGCFHRCGCCRKQWSSWDEFALDPAVRLLGLQSVITLPDANLLVFEHSCGSSISILARRLRHLLPNPEAGASHPRLEGTDRCKGHCLSLEDLAACDMPCSNSRDRELILLVQEKKRKRRDS